MTNIIKIILFLLIIFTPIAFGSVELWAFSTMELGILLIIILWSIQNMLQIKSTDLRINPFTLPRIPNSASNNSVSAFNSQLRTPHSALVIIALFLLLILFQLLPLPPGLLKILSPKTFEIRHQLQIPSNHLAVLSPSFAASAPGSSGLSTLRSPLSLFPFATQVEFFKWLTLFGLFLFLVRSKLLYDNGRIMRQLIIVILLMGVAESLYGMSEFFSGHKYILHPSTEADVSSVTGTFLNPNYFAGYLLMVIPLSVGYLFSRESLERVRYSGWRHRLSSIDGKTLFLGFCIIVMILALLFSASRMGISSLLLSFTLLALLFRSPSRRERFSRTSILILGLALLWAAWIGLDAVISRFFTSSEDFKGRWVFWVNTFQIFRDFPIFGSGLGTFTWIFPMYRSDHLIGMATHAENDYLQLASEVGLVGVVLLLILLVFLSYKTVFGIRLLSHREPERYIGIGSLVGILALMLHSVVERNIQVPSNAFLYTILWAIALRVSLHSKEVIKSLSN